MSENSNLEIPFEYKVSTINFSIPDQYSSSNLKVAYKLKGLNNDWIHLTQGQRDITLTGLSYNKYQLQIKYSIDGINWNEFPNQLTLDMLPPWWLSIWFKLFILILIVAGLITLYYIRTARIRFRNKLLKETVAERTASLHESNLNLLEKNDEATIQNEHLEQLNHEYKKQAHLIIQQQNIILAKNRDLNRIIEHVSLNDNGEIKAIFEELNSIDQEIILEENLVKIALFKTINTVELNETIAHFAFIQYCNSDEDILEFVPDFIIIDEHFKENITLNINHFPLISIVGENALMNPLMKIAEISLSKESIQKELPKLIAKYILSRKIINARFTKNESLTYDIDAPNSADNEFIEKIIAVIEMQLSNTELDSEILAKELSLSRTVLYSKIKQLTDMGVHEFIKMIRVKKSVNLLKEKKLNVSQIAYEVGFSSPSYYIRCFVKQFGLPPKEYINQNK